MDILIKSFNRPHYLDRCINSILKYASGYENVMVLDDGTPKKYLDKIQTKYPFVQIKKSDQYEIKSNAILKHEFDKGKLNGFTIPTNLWIKAVKNASDYILVTEDDVWFTQKIDLAELVNSMQKNQTQLTKLGWLGNFTDDQNLSISEIDENINRTIPKDIFTGPEWLMDLYIFNKYKFFSLLCRFKLADNYSKRKYWALNSILMGLYQKDYWLHIWKDSTNSLNEKIQLRNAATYYHKNKSNKNLIARTKVELMKTTFKSTASGVYHDYGNNLDINRVNYILNEAWYEDKFDVMENFPHDFSDDYIGKFIDEANHPDAQFEQWITWTEHFKQQYRNLGANVD